MIHTDEDDEMDDAGSEEWDPEDHVDHLCDLIEGQEVEECMDTQAVRAIESLGAMGHLTALELGIAYPSLAALRSCFTTLAATGQLRVLLAYTGTILSKVKHLAPSLQGLVAALSVDEHSCVARSTLYKLCCNDLADFRALRFLILVVKTPLSLIDARHILAMRDLSVKGQLRHHHLRATLLSRTSGTHPRAGPASNTAVPHVRPPRARCDTSRDAGITTRDDRSAARHRQSLLLPQRPLSAVASIIYLASSHRRLVLASGRAA